MSYNHIQFKWKHSTTSFINNAVSYNYDAVSHEHHPTGQTSCTNLCLSQCTVLIWPLFRSLVSEHPTNNSSTLWFLNILAQHFCFSISEHPSSNTFTLWFLNIPATGNCILGADPLRQLCGTTQLHDLKHAVSPCLSISTVRQPVPPRPYNCWHLTG